MANLWSGWTDPGRVSTIRLWNRMNAVWVCATARFSSLRKSGMIALLLALFDVQAPRGRSNPFSTGSPPAATVLPMFSRRLPGR